MTISFCRQRWTRSARRVVATVVVLGAASACSFPLLAAEATMAAAQPPRAAASATEVCDISLDRQGRLSGLVADAQGAPAANVEVVLERISRQGKPVVARGATDERGAFRFASVGGGSYLVSAAGGQTAIRAWKAGAAPPAAAPGVLVVADDEVARGQSTTSRVYQFLEERPAITYAAITAAIVIPIVEIADDEDEKKNGS